MKKEENQIVPYEDSRYSKSNFLISAKYKSGIVENKITAISLAKIQNSEYKKDENGRLVCEMPASELKKLLNGNDGSFYNQLEPVAQSMTSRSIGISNPESGEFDYISVVDRATYKDGVFTIRYNADFENYIANLTKNFTVLELPIMLKFKSVYSFRVYELLSSKAYYPKGQERNDKTFLIKFSLSELKLELGIVNAELDSVRKILKKGEKPDYDKAVSASPERTFDSWYDFRRYVLDVAKKEINEKTNMHIEYEPQKSGRGGKVHGVNFVVQLDYSEPIDDLTEENVVTDLTEQSVDLTEDEKFDFHVEVKQMFADYKLGIKDVEKISEAAGYNIQKVQHARSLLKMNRGNIDNVTGWLLSCIKNNYQTSAKQSIKKETVFDQYQKSVIDYDELEQKLLDE